jgi:hypothetical protein
MTSRLVGPLTLVDDRHTSALIHQLNMLFGSRRLVVTCVNASDEPDDSLSTVYSHMSGDVRRSSPMNQSRYDSIYIPIGLGINLPVGPLWFEGDGTEYHSTIDINSDHVQIVIPYLYGYDGEPLKLARRRYAITALHR